MKAIKRIQNVRKMHFVSRRKWLFAFLEGCKNQNTQTKPKVFAIGDTLGQQLGMWKKCGRCIYMVCFLKTFFLNMKNFFFEKF